MIPRMLRFPHGQWEEEKKSITMNSGKLVIRKKQKTEYKSAARFPSCDIINTLAPYKESV